MATLKVEDWKTVLDLPKNAGLKAFGETGISDLLRQHTEAEKAYETKPSNDAADKVEDTLGAISLQCQAIVKKHKQVFVTACEYLT